MKNCKLLITFLGFLIISACSPISKDEDNGIKSILNFYGGKCEYGVFVSGTLNDKAAKCFKIELSGSSLIQHYSDVPDMTTSNIALLFYKNLQEERNKYDCIQSTVTLQNNRKHTFTYPIEQIKRVSEKLYLVDSVVQMIKGKRFHSISPLLNDTALIKYDKSELIANMEKIDDSFGNVKGFHTAGFKFYTAKNGNVVLHISGIVARDKQNNELSIDLDPKSEVMEILFLQYKL